MKRERIKELIQISLLETLIKYKQAYDITKNKELKKIYYKSMKDIKTIVEYLNEDILIEKMTKK